MTLSNLLKTLLLGAVGDPDSAKELISLLQAAAILPSQSGQSGKFLTTNGTITSWGTPSGGGGAATVREAFDANVNITNADQYVIYGSATGTPFNVNLPAGTNGKVFTLISKSTSTSDYTLVANGSDAFDGNVGTFDPIGSIIFSNGIWYKANG
jgi:hypothetical protein